MVKVINFDDAYNVPLLTCRWNSGAGTIPNPLWIVLFFQTRMTPTMATPTSLVIKNLRMSQVIHDYIYSVWCNLNYDLSFQWCNDDIIYLVELCTPTCMNVCLLRVLEKYELISRPTKWEPRVELSGAIENPWHERTLHGVRGRILAPFEHLITKKGKEPTQEKRSKLGAHWRRYSTQCPRQGVLAPGVAEMDSSLW